VSGAQRPARPGKLGDGDRAALVELVALARRSHEWAVLADRLVRLWGWGESRLRRVCRDHGPDPAAVGDPLAGAGWWAPRPRGERCSGCRWPGCWSTPSRAEVDGVAVMAGWTRLWHGPSLPGWWAAQRVESRPAARVRRDARADRVRALVAGGATVTAAAAQVGVDPSGAYRYLRPESRAAPEEEHMPTLESGDLTGLPDLSGHRVLVPGGTGAVGEGVVRTFLAAGADVLVPTRSPQRLAEFRDVLSDAATDRLHLVVHDYTTFAGAADLAEQMVTRLGGIDDVVAPIGGWWAGRTLAEIDEADWQGAFLALATTHMAVLRACLPRMSGRGAYSLVVGDSATTPVPGSGLVSIEQAALLMMQRVAAAEADGRTGRDRRRVVALVLGPVRTRQVESGDASWVSADQVGAVAAELAAGAADDDRLLLGGRNGADEMLTRLRASRIGDAAVAR